MKQKKFSHQIVDFIPERLDEGRLYVSQKYGTAVHKCACGCGEEVVTPLNPTDWTFRIEKAGATLNPSIGNWSFACQSHYWIRNGRVVWAGAMSRHQIERGRTYDLERKLEYFEVVNREKAQPRHFLLKPWAAFKRWWNSRGWGD